MKYITGEDEAHTYQSWLKMRETFEKVLHWRALLARGYSQSMIASEKDLTRARVCQLIKLLQNIVWGDGRR
jgi:hypothetical protein